ncbi:hypothetical protein GX50_08695, partial [[Emmonsia] crescens]
MQQENQLRGCLSPDSSSPKLCGSVAYRNMQEKTSKNRVSEAVRHFGFHSSLFSPISSFSSASLPTKQGKAGAFINFRFSFTFSLNDQVRHPTRDPAAVGAKV